MNPIDILNHWGARFVDFALPMLIQSSLLIVLLFALDLVLRNRVRAVVRYALWMLVLIKLVLPPSFAAPTGLAYWLPRKKAVQTHAALSPRFVARYSDVKLDEARPLPSLPPPRAKLQFVGWLLLGWLATTLGLMAWLVRRSRFVIQTASHALPASESPEQLLDACRQQMGIKQRVRLKLSATASSPAVCGLWRPVMLVPQQLSNKLSALQLRAVLLHELAHIKRGDVWVHYAQTLLQIFYWWHPLLWLANAHIRRVREQAVDEAVVVAMGSEAETYPATLLEVAKLAFKRPMLALGLIGIVESKSALAQRIHRMIDRPVPKSARLGFAGLAALLLAGAAFLPMARGQRTPYQPPRFVSEPDPQPVVEMEAKFVEIEESELAALGLGEPTLTEFNGHRAWALTPEQLNGVLQRTREQTGADILTAPRVTTFSGRPGRIQVADIAPVEGNGIRVGPTCDLIPYVSGELIDLAVVASVTERRPVDPIVPFNSVADAFLTNEVGTARVIVGNGGGVVLENPEARSSKGNRYLVIVSAAIISADHAAESQTFNQGSGNATSAATQKHEIPAATVQNRTPTPQTKSENVRPIDAATKGKANESESEPLTVIIAKAEFALSTGQDIEIEAIKPAEIQYDSQTGICVVTNDFVIRFNGAVLTAHRCQVNTKTGEVIAEGSVTLQRGDQVLRAERIQYNFIHQNVTESNAANRGTTNEGEKAGDGSVSRAGSRPEKVPILGDLPFLGRLLRSDSTTNSLQREEIKSQLNRVILPELFFDNVPLPKAIEWLAKQAAERDPDLKRMDFLLSPYVVGAARPTTMEPTTVDPITGKPITLPSPGPLDMNSVKVRIDPALKNVRLVDAIEAIVYTANKPIRYTIEDYGVAFSPKPPDLETRIFRVNSQRFLQHLRENFRGTLTTNELSLALRDFFAAAGVNVQPPNLVWYKDRAGTLMVRASAEELDRVHKAIEALNVAPPQVMSRFESVEGAQVESKELGFDWFLGNTLLSNGPLGSQGGTAAPQEDRTKPVSSPTPLETRVFRVDPATLREGLKRTSGVLPFSGEKSEEILRKQLDGVAINSVQDALRSFFTAIGVDVHPPNGVFFNDRTGVLMVRATAKELDTVQKALELLNYSPPLITIEAKFVEVGQKDAKVLGFDWLSGNAALANGTMRVPSRPPGATSNGTNNFVGVLTASQVKAAFKAMEQRAGTDILSIPKVTTLSGRQAQISLLQATEVGGKAIQTGPELEILPAVSADGITLNLDASAAVTDVLKSRGIRRARTRKVQGQAAVYDGQTLVLSNPAWSGHSRQPDGQSVHDAVREDAGKQLLVFITATIIDPAGNPIHVPGKEPFPADQIPAQ